jgi:hypothetical protein
MPLIINKTGASTGSSILYRFIIRGVIGLTDLDPVFELKCGLRHTIRESTMEDQFTCMAK